MQNSFTIDIHSYPWYHPHKDRTQGIMYSAAFLPFFRHVEFDFVAQFHIPERAKTNRPCTATHGPPNPLKKPEKKPPPDSGHRIIPPPARFDGSGNFFIMPLFLVTVDTFSGSTLKLLHLDRRQMGAYLCIASNDVPPAVSKRITLNINCKLRISCTRRYVAVFWSRGWEFLC